MKKLWTGLVSLCCIAIMVMNMPISAKAYIQWQGKVKTASAVIRAEASSESEAVASVVEGNSLTINNEAKDGSGMVWYQVFVDANTLGYIRSDLIAQSDSSKNPNTGGDAAADTDKKEEEKPVSKPDTDADSNTDTTGNADAAPSEEGSITEMPAQQAKIIGAIVRIREKATTSSTIVTNLEKDTLVKLTGKAVDNNGKTWYRAVFDKDGVETMGYIRSDFVELGEVLEPEEPAVTEPEPEEVIPEVVEPDDYEVEFRDGEAWYLIDHINGKSVKVEELFQAVEENAVKLEESEAVSEKQKIIIILLAIVIVILVLTVTLLLFKVRDLSYDDFYGEYDEPETVSRRTASSKTAVRERMPQGQPRQGQPVRQPRPVQGQPQGQPRQGQPVRQPRPVQGQPQGQPRQGQPVRQSRPVQGQPQGQPRQGQPVRQPRPVQGGQPGQEQSVRQPRPVQGGQPEQSRPKQPRQIQNPTTEQLVQDARNTGWKSKNFVTDEDEFDFEFLNWDGEE